MVVSCLDCNLKKRRRRTDAFVFTQQLDVKRLELELELEPRK
jgi:hypothetical protein